MKLKEQNVEETFYTEIRRVDVDCGSVEGNVTGCWITLKCRLWSAAGKMYGWTEGSARDVATWY